MTTKQVVRKEVGAVAVPGLEELQKEAGFIEVRQELMSIPRLQLGQAMSDTVQAGLGKVGEFVSKVKGKNYGSSVKIIPILVSESAALMEKGTKKLICKSNDTKTNTNGVPCVKCPHKQYWGNWDNGSPECKTSIDVVCIVEDEFDMPQILSFRKTSFKAGKALLNLTKYDKYKVPFGSQYTIKSAVSTKDDHKFYVIEDSMTKEQLTEQQLANILPMAKKLLDMKKQGRIKHEDEGAEEPIYEGGDPMPEGDLPDGI
jgi:hypothetical protein